MTAPATRFAEVTRSAPPRAVSRQISTKAASASLNERVVDENTGFGSFLHPAHAPPMVAGNVGVEAETGAKKTKDNSQPKTALSATDWVSHESGSDKHCRLWRERA